MSDKPVKLTNWRREKRNFKRTLQREWAGGAKAFKRYMKPAAGGPQHPNTRRALNWI